MGMFDYIKVDCELPGLGVVDMAHWQTKDTPNQMLDHYVISADKRLLGPDAADLEYHGYVEFYGEVEEEFYEFRAKFTDGRAVEFKQIQPEVAQV